MGEGDDTGGSGLSVTPDSDNLPFVMAVEFGRPDGLTVRAQPGGSKSGSGNLGTVLAWVGISSNYPFTGKEIRMRKVLFTFLALGLFATALVGCRAEGELDTASNVVVPR
jgi:hypothetical protein